MDNNCLRSEAFLNGLRDYFYLINRNFPEKGTLKLVGDRYRLNGDQRTILYRGITSEEKAGRRTGRLSVEIKDKYLLIDGYNVLFTLLNYRLGRITFISNDRIVRDAGSLHGKLRDEDLFMETLDLLFDFLTEHKPSFVHFYIDSPVSLSTFHNRIINEKIRKNEISGICEIVKSPDQSLKKHSEGIIATSDSVIIDKTGNAITDLPCLVLKSGFRARFVDLNEILAKTRFDGMNKDL
ncbi:MAG: DUF434 domain-containing protein [Bacteroidales bacterium]|nr:DUF434 domain-containing protein [Bacteroidales bacterium]